MAASPGRREARGERADGCHERSPGTPLPALPTPRLRLLTNSWA